MPEYFTLAELRALPDVSSAVKYPDATVEAAAAYVVGRIESFVDSTFIPRSVIEVYDGVEANRSPTPTVALRKRHPVQVTALTESGNVYDAGALAELVIDGIFLRRRVSGSWVSWRPWQPGLQNLSITYTAGFSTVPPADVKETALWATRDRLITLVSSASHNERARAVTNEYGTTSLATADEDHPFGLPAVDSVLAEYRSKFETIVG
jgi:hypothetical protein